MHRQRGGQGRTRSPWAEVAGGIVVIDRRQFLKLTAAAGLGTAGTTMGWRLVAGQDGAPEAVSGEVADIVTAMAATLGHDQERIFRFVADEVRYEPYAGILRGANGTLAARAGNSADQALLLAALLRASDVPVRFVSGTLDDAAAAALMAATVVGPEAARERMLQSLLSDEDVAAGIAWTASGGASPEGDRAARLELSGIREALERDRADLGVRAARHIDESLDTISTALVAAGIELGPPLVSVMPPLERERHTWVQAQDGSAWIDLDPTSGDLAPGDTVAVVAETLDVLPDELRHLVDFTVIAETLMGGALAQEPILEVSFFADELAYRNLLFAHVRTDDLGDIDLVGAGLSGGTEYNPLLVFGTQTAVGQRPISIGGSGGAFVDAFGGGGGEGLVEGETSAEWLEVAVTSPGADPVVARRTIFDRVGTELRDSGVIDPYAIPPAEFIDLGDGVGAQYLPARSVRAFSVTGGTPNLRMLVQELALDEGSALSLATGIFDMGRALVGAEVAGSLGSLSYPDAPAVTSIVGEPTATGTRVGLDVWHRAFGTLGLADVRPTVPPAMLAGVIPHAVERAIVPSDPTPDEGPDGPALGVGAVFDAAAAQGIPTRLLAGSLPSDGAWDAESRRLLQQALDDGRLVIIPERPVDLGGRPRLGWWLVDPASGSTIDQMDDGGGQVIIQYVIYPTIIILALYALTAFGDRILCAFGFDARAIEGDVRAALGLSPGTSTTSCGGQGSTTTPPRSGGPMRPMERPVQSANPYTTGAPDPGRAGQEKKRRRGNR